MIETICPNCGNKKTFDDSYAGRTFRCPNCKEPVTIQSVVEMVKDETDSHEISFEAELKKAEEEKKRKEEQQRYRAQLKQLEDAARGRRVFMWFQVVVIVVMIIAWIWGGGEPSVGTYIMTAIPPILFIVLYNKDKKAKAEIEAFKNEHSKKMANNK